MHKNTAIVCICAMLVLMLAFAGWQDGKRFDPRVQALKECSQLAAQDRANCFNAVAATFKEQGA